MLPKIAILFGGRSSEYAVSLKSAHAVVTHIDREQYEPVMLGITRGGDWYRFTGDPAKIADDTWLNPSDCVPAVISPDRDTHGILEFRAGTMRAVHLDAAMPVLHGKNGEDGTVQGLLELAGIPVAGCGTLASALCMDKDRAHKLVSLAGIRVPRSFVLNRTFDAQTVAAQAEELGYPLFAKPVRAGSSHGITMVTSRSGLAAAIALAFEYDGEVVVEERIAGFEVGCAVMGNDELIVGKPDEIELSSGFFDFNEKYSLETSAIHVPARVLPEVAARITGAAALIYKTLGCKGFARVDMFLTPSGELVFNEVNTIPGFTAHSRFPNMLKAAGYTFAQVVSMAIELAVNP